MLKNLLHHKLGVFIPFIYPVIGMIFLIISLWGSISITIFFFSKEKIDPTTLLIDDKKVNQAIDLYNQTISN